MAGVLEVDVYVLDVIVKIDTSFPSLKRMFITALLKYGQTEPGVSPQSSAQGYLRRPRADVKFSLYYYC